MQEGRAEVQERREASLQEGGAEVLCRGGEEKGGREEGQVNGGGEEGEGDSEEEGR